MIRARGRAVLLAGLVLVALINLAASIYLSWTDSLDLATLRREARLIFAREDPFRVALEGPATPRARAVLEEAPKRDVFHPDYFPSALLPIYPFAIAPWGVQKILWLLVNLLSCAGLVAFLWRLWPDRARHDTFVVAILIWIAGTPFRANLELGQLTTVALGLTFIARELQMRGRWLAAGLCVALALSKYAYIWPFILFFFVLERAWKTLIVAGSIHGATHLAICKFLGADFFAILAEALQVNARIFNREARLTFWSPFRGLAAALPDAGLPATFLGGVACVSAVGWLAWKWKSRPVKTPVELMGWVFMFGHIATLTISLKWYCLIYFVFGWLWCLALPTSPETKWRRPVILIAMVYLSIFHRLEWAAAERLPNTEAIQAALALIFNGTLALLCVSSAFLFHRTMGAENRA